MKKSLDIMILGTFLVSMINFANASPIVAGIQDGINSVYQIFKPLLKQIVGNSATSDLFLAKILFLIIIFSIVWKALSNINFFRGNEWTLWTVSIAVSILAIRWIGNSAIVNTILLPYSAFGVAIMSGLPFILYFMIVKGFRKTARKISWIFFIVVFLGLWVMRFSEIKNFAYIYLVTAGLAFIVLLNDKTVMKIFAKMKVEKSNSKLFKMQIRGIEEEMRKVRDSYNDKGDNYTAMHTKTKRKGTDAYLADIQYLQDEIAKLKTHF